MGRCQRAQRTQRRFLGGQCMGVMRVDGAHQMSGAEQNWSTGYKLHPSIVGLVDRDGGSSVEVHGHDLLTSLSAVHDHHH